MNNVRDKVNQVFREILDDETIQIFDDMTPDHVKKWDSLAHINLIFALEQAFKIRFTTEELSVVQSVGELTKSIEDKLAAR